MTVHLDFETFSEADLPSVGAFRYAEDPSTEALIVSYKIGNDPVVGVDLTKKRNLKQLAPLFAAVEAGEKVAAHNSQFERLIWEHCCKEWPVRPKPLQWDCTAVRASAISVPRSLELAAVALGLNVHKDPRGKALIHRFSKPQRDGSRIRPKDDPVQFAEFIKYCKQDTVVESELDHILPKLHPNESRLFALDYKINKQGIPIDVSLVKKAIAFVEETSRALLKSAKKISGLKPTQRDKLLEWLNDNGVEMETLQAAEVERMIANPDLPRNVRRILEMRIELSRAGVKKLKTMLACASPDGRIRGSFWFHSASTGRWGALRVQPHNLSKPDKAYPQDEVIECLLQDSLDLLYDRPLTALSKAIRGFIAAPPGQEFLIADYAAIEARGLAWLADEEWLVKLFRQGRDVYKAMASEIFGVPYDQVTDAQRFFGKQTVLGSGYGMGWQKFIITCAKFGVKVSEQQAKRVIKKYRESVPNIVAFWTRVERAAIRTILTGKPTSIQGGRLVFTCETLPNGFKVLFITLPSGRRIAYPQPRVDNVEKWGKLRPTLIFKAIYRSMWVDEETYGGKLVENIIQAMCRDSLADGMTNVDAAGLPVFLHVHDEIGAEIRKGSYGVEAFEQLVCKPKDWARGVPLSAEGKTCVRYSK